MPADRGRKETTMSLDARIGEVTERLRRRSETSCVISRGRLLDGFAPATSARSACARSSRLIDPAPDPYTLSSATAEALWQ